MHKADANVLSSRPHRSLLGNDMDGTKIALIIHVSRKYLAPVLIGGLVVWLVANELGDWADAVCSVASAMAIAVEACVK